MPSGAETDSSMANDGPAAEPLPPATLSPELTHQLAVHAGRIIELISANGDTFAEFKLEVARGEDRVARERWVVWLIRVDETEE